MHRHVFLYHYTWQSRDLCLSKNRAIAVLLLPSVLLGKFSPRSLVSSPFGVVICKFFFLKATFAVDLVFSLYCKLNFENNREKENLKSEMLYFNFNFNFRVFWFYFCREKQRNCGSLQIVYRYFLNAIYAHVDNYIMMCFAQMLSKLI